MKLPAILHRDPAAKIEAAQILLTAAETRIEQLDVERHAALVGDSVEEVIRLDRLIDEQRRAATIHRDRIAALQVDVRRQEWQRRERERTAAIDKVLVPFEAECADMAAELEKALAAACYLFERIEARRGVMLENWPAAIPRPSIYTLDFSYLRHELFRSHPAYDGARFIFELRRRLPKIGASVREHVAGYIARCRAVSIVPAEFLPPPEPELPDDDEAEQAA